MENYRPGTMEKLGLGYDVLKQTNPRIIYGSVSGFGHVGRYSRRPGYDIIAQAMSGIMSVNGEQGGEPLRVILGTAEGVDVERVGDRIVQRDLDDLGVNSPEPQALSQDDGVTAVAVVAHHIGQDESDPQGRFAHHFSSASAPVTLGPLASLPAPPAT